MAVGHEYGRVIIHVPRQSRGHAVPIKFNGMLFMTQAGSSGPVDVDHRQWGPDHWWQNTRLPYWNMLTAGDADSLRVVLDWVSGFIPLASARTHVVLPEGNEGIFFTEVSDINGLYQGGLYGCTDSSRAGESCDCSVHTAVEARRGITRRLSELARG